jgi:Glutathione peroxidase
MNGKDMDLSELKGKVVLIVNTASKCGLTPQFAGLEELHRKFADRGLVVLGFPCGQFAGQELDSGDEIHSFCQRNYGVTFEMFEKIDVNGKNAHPVFSYLRKRTGGLFGDAIKWNFTKFLVSRDGKTMRRFAPTTNPSSLAGTIDRFLDQA